MHWNVCGVKDEVREGLCCFLNYWGIASSTDGVQIQVCEGDVLSVRREGKGYTVTYQDYSGMFRGLALLRHSLECGDGSIDVTESKRFDTCGVMIDCSRNAVPKVSKMKEIFCKLACIGLNRCMLYTEDTYELKEYPYFGYMRGAYTEAELKELDDCASSFGIELVPCIQTLGHLRQVLRWPFADNMKDTADILLIGADETYRLIESMFKTCSRCFRSKNIHIGMDEAHDVGLGKYLDKNGYRDRVAIMMEHLQRVGELAEKYDLSPMMWSDMIFKLCFGTENHYNCEAELPAEIKEMMPENLTLVHWDYYSSDEKIYDSMFKCHQSIGNKVVFAGAIWKWAGSAIQYDKTFETTIPAMNSAGRNGIKDVMATIWGDDGAEVPFDTSWLGIQLFGEYNYYSEVSEEHLKTRFKQCLGYDADFFKALQIDDYPKEWCHGIDALYVSKMALYQDVLCGLFDKNFEGIPLKEHFEEHINRLNNAVCPAGMEKIRDYYLKLLEVISLKCNMGLEISKAYKSGSNEMLLECVEDLKRLEAMVLELQLLFADVWESENKIFGLDRIDLRFGGLVGRIKTAVRRIEGYVSGKYDVLEELEYEKLMYGGEDVLKGKSLISANFYDKISTVSSSGAI